MKGSELGCVKVNMLLPLFEEYIQEKNDSLKRHKERDKHWGERTRKYGVSS